MAIEKITKLGIQEVEVYIPDAADEELEESTMKIDVKAIYEERLHVIIGIDENMKTVAMYLNPIQGYKYLIYPHELSKGLKNVDFQYEFDDNAEIEDWPEAVQLFKNLYRQFH